MLDRINAPQILPIGEIDFVKPKIFDITKSAKLFFMKEVPNDTARIDLIFDAGSTKGDLGVASLVNGLLLSGTSTKSSVDIHAELDALGAFFESNVGHENAVLTVYSLKENLLPILHVLKDAIENLAFPEHEVEELISDRKQRFRVNMEKVSFLAQRSLQENLFANSTYGRIIEENDYDSITKLTMKHFFRENYLNGLMKVVVVGDFTQDQVDEIIDITGSWTLEGIPAYENTIQQNKGIFHTEKESALQTAIRIGRILFNKTHPDFVEFQVLNTILGDYFGSRLMSNIREDKGYTYGIGSMMAEFQETGYFLIATEVGKEVKDATLVEIQHEILRLQEELVDENELELVKNYLLGQLLKSADGPYSLIDLYMGLEPYGMEMDFYNNSIHTIQKITPERIRELAKQYLNWNEMTIVSAG